MAVFCCSRVLRGEPNQARSRRADACDSAPTSARRTTRWPGWLCWPRSVTATRRVGIASGRWQQREGFPKPRGSGGAADLAQGLPTGCRRLAILVEFRSGKMLRKNVENRLDFSFEKRKVGSNLSYSETTEP